MCENDSANPICHYSSKLYLQKPAKPSFDHAKPEEDVGTDSESKEIFQLTFAKEDCLAAKARLAKRDPVIDPYVNHADHEFRDLDLPLGQKDFCVALG